MNMLLFVGYSFVVMSALQSNHFFAVMGLLCVTSSIGLSFLEVYEPMLRSRVRDKILDQITKQEEYERLK